MEWLPGDSATVAPARSAIVRWAGGGIMRSSVATRYQVGLLRRPDLRLRDTDVAGGAVVDVEAIRTVVDLGDA